MTEQLRHESQGVVATSVESAAHLLGIGVRAAWSLVRTGELKSFRVGKRRLVRVADVEAFAAERVGEKTEAAAEERGE